MRFGLHLLLIFLLYAKPAESSLKVDLGEKLFTDDRFSQSFYSQSSHNLNQKINSGDPILEWLETPSGDIRHPQRGQQISCSSCHMVDQASQVSENLVFTYNDFSVRSRVPFRNDGAKRSVRNSMNLVISSLQDGTPLHWDGEFFTAEDLSCASLVGRNMGWKNSESQSAKAHIIQVLRQDDGTYPTSSDITEPYKATFAQLGYAIDQMNDSRILKATCEVMAAYLKDIDFSRDDKGQFNGSSYDHFLQLNNIRKAPLANESPDQYTEYLQQEIQTQRPWKWVEASDMQYHRHQTQFGPQEFKGMKIFFKNKQCASCHQPPNFTDSGFHNIGISQLSYDSVHGTKKFKSLEIPNWQERLQKPNKFFTATAETPQRQEVFRKTPQLTEPLFSDLGVWNMWGHPDKAHLQEHLKKVLCKSHDLSHCDSWSPAEYLDRSLAAFKTPTLRSLGQSPPYFHDGSANNLLDVLTTYLATSRLARKGKLRNAGAKIKKIKLHPGEFPALKAFLESLDEDYD